MKNIEISEGSEELAKALGVAYEDEAISGLGTLPRKQVRNLLRKSQIMKGLPPEQMNGGQDAGQQAAAPSGIEDTAFHGTKDENEISRIVKKLVDKGFSAGADFKVIKKQDTFFLKFNDPQREAEAKAALLGDYSEGETGNGAGGGEMLEWPVVGASYKLPFGIVLTLEKFSKEGKLIFVDNNKKKHEVEGVEFIKTLKEGKVEKTESGEESEGDENKVQPAKENDKGGEGKKPEPDKDGEEKPDTEGEGKPAPEKGKPGKESTFDRMKRLKDEGGEPDEDDESGEAKGDKPEPKDEEPDEKETEDIDDDMIVEPGKGNAMKRAKRQQAKKNKKG